MKALRCALIEEVAAEFRAALEADDPVEVADALADLLYVVYGAALSPRVQPRRGWDPIGRVSIKPRAVHTAERPTVCV